MKKKFAEVAHQLLLPFDGEPIKSKSIESSLVHKRNPATVSLMQCNGNELKPEDDTKKQLFLPFPSLPIQREYMPLERLEAA